MALVLVSLSLNVAAQDTTITYFDKDWDETSEDKAKFKRKGFATDEGWGVIDTYLSSGIVQMTGTFKTKKVKKRIGDFMYYYENGEKEYGGSYSDGKRIGEWNYWYENGNKKLHIPNYIKGKSTGVETGWKEEGELDFKCSYVKDKMSGISKWYHPNGEVSSEEVFKNDKLQDYTHFTEEGKELANTKYLRKAKYRGGIKALYRYLKEEVEYVQEAIEDDVEGTVIVAFVINEEGSVTDIKVQKSVDQRLDKEALRVIEEMPKWRPAKLHNRGIKMSFTIPVKFDLY